MILKTPDYKVKIDVRGCFTGHRCDSIEIDARDAQQLSEMSDEELGRYFKEVLFTRFTPSKEVPQ